MENDTIAAIATPMGSNGIGIIRISGERSISILKELFQRSIAKGSLKHGHSQSRLTSHVMYYGHIVHPQKKHIIDEVLAVTMQGPRSYTREDVVEIHTHSGPVILASILALILEKGVRLAEPGEFTKRAFLNGRIDLSQAEAVADMVASKTEAAMNLAAVQLTGGMKTEVSDILAAIDAIRVDLEAAIEFGEEIDSQPSMESLERSLKRKIIAPIDRLISVYHDAHVLRDGIRLDIIGKPNVGKSSLLNCFLQKDKAIVTDIPGTTRDPVEDYTAIDGIPIRITDTAGLHDTLDPVEQAGILKTRASLEKSDIVLFVVDGSQGLNRQDLEIWNQLEHKNVLLVINKIDLVDRPDPFRFGDLTPSPPMVMISAKFGTGIQDLKQKIKAACLLDQSVDPGHSIIPSLRQKHAFEGALDAARRARGTIEGSFDPALIIEDLNQANTELSKISGNDIDEDLLDQIFGKFCIGK